MKERPIIFSAPMVRSILAGQKSQTRRVVKPQPHEDCSPLEVGHYHPTVIDRNGDEQPGAERFGAWTQDGEQGWVCPYGQPGDRLWVVTMRPIIFGNGKYAAGDDGHIYDISGIEPRRRKPAVTDKGYEEISLRASGERRNFRVNRLVAEAFYGTQPYDLPVCRHLDGDRRNNRPENLDWGTEAQNSADATAVGAWSGSANGGARLTATDVALIRSSDEPQAALAHRFGVTQPTISKIKSGKRWRAEHPAPPPPNLPRWASRITLEISGIRVERLQDISEADAIAEGCNGGHGSIPGYTYNATPEEHYRHVWESLHGAGSWDANPWVWTLEFRRVEGGAA